MLPTDSLDYEVLQEAIQLIPQVDGLLSLEIGVREGGSSQMIMEGLAKRHRSYVHVAVDHYGSMPQAHSDMHPEQLLDYTNRMRNRAIPQLFGIADELGINFIFYNMDDTEFFTRFNHGVPVYNRSTKQIYNEYGFVFFDGPHATNLVMNEAVWFANRAANGAVFVFDDVSNFDMDSIAKELEVYGFETHKRTPTKAVLRKVK